MCVGEASKVGHKEEIKEQLDIGRFLIVLKLRVVKYCGIVSVYLNLFMGCWMVFLRKPLLFISNRLGGKTTPNTHQRAPYQRNAKGFHHDDRF
jgi:hypothetical protein